MFLNFADEQIKKEQIGKAEQFYKISKILNPFNKDLEQRNLIVKALKEDRSPSTDETLAYSENPLVLGVNATVPVLMYHYIRVNPYTEDKVGFGLSVTPENFNAQMDYLSAHGYQTITLDELGAALLQKTKLPPKPIVITLDDGYTDSYTAAYPILKAHGFKATNFIITGFVGGPNYLTWEQIKEMNKSGVFNFGAHTTYHSALTYLSTEAALTDLVKSKNVLSEQIGYPVNWFAYPYGNYDDRIAKTVKKAGFIGAFTTNKGSLHSADFMFTLPRIRMGGGESVEMFASKLPWK